MFIAKLASLAVRRSCQKGSARCIAGGQSPYRVKVKNPNAPTVSASFYLGCEKQLNYQNGLSFRIFDGRSSPKRPRILHPGSNVGELARP